jgi:GGDEF domain-containing protein/PAS domain-containing protein
MKYPIPSNEVQRLAALHNLSILDSPREAGFNELANLTREVFGVESALISLIDRDRQWFKATAGLDLCETSRETAFCNYTICSDEPFIVSDASSDARFCNNPLVLGEPRIRLYAGVPLSLEAGVQLGTLCLIDSTPRVFTSGEIRQLRQLGNLAQALLEQYQTSRKLSCLWARSVEQLDLISSQALDLKKQKRILDCASALAKLGAWERDVETDQLEWSDGLYKLHEVERTDSTILHDHFHLYPEPERSQLSKLMATSRATNSGFTFEGRMYTAEGNLRWVRVVSDVEVVDGRVVRRFGMKQDITEQKLLSARVEHLAFCDDLTGMNNRRGLRKRFVELERHGSRLLNVFLFDLDGFKDINDHHGHSAGDACLRRVARRVRSTLPSDCFIARVGGDEFVVLSTDPQSLSMNLLRGSELLYRAPSFGAVRRSAYLAQSG